MDPYEAPFHPHDQTGPAPTCQNHGLPLPNRKLIREPLQQHRPFDALPMCGQDLVGSQTLTRTSDAASSGIQLPRSLTLGAVPDGLHPRRTVAGSLQPAHRQMPGAVPAGLHPPHPQTVPGGLQTPGVVSGGLQQAPAGAYGPRKLPDSDAPPNVTVSTSTIPLSMAGSLQQRGGGDLSSIVHQISQLCQARAGAGATSVCEGQIANPSPISRNLLINASSRVSAPGPPDTLASPPPGAAVRSQLGPPVAKAVAVFPADAVQVHRQCVWTQPPEGVRPCKSIRLDRAAERAFPARTLGYLCKPLSPVGPPGPYADRANSPWGASQVPTGFQAGRVVGAKYRLSKEILPGHSKMASDLDFLGGRDFVAAGFPDPAVDSMDSSAAGPPRGAACALHRAYP
ncbi:uncharacterized protein LOC144051982 [Vanacampus margaritifer]